MNGLAQFQHPRFARSYQRLGLVRVVAGHVDALALADGRVDAELEQFSFRPLRYQHSSTHILGSARKPA